MFDDDVKNEIVSAGPRTPRVPCRLRRASWQNIMRPPGTDASVGPVTVLVPNHTLHDNDDVPPLYFLLVLTMAGLRTSVFISAVSFLLGMCDLTHTFSQAPSTHAACRAVLRTTFHALDCGFLDIVEVTGNADRSPAVDVRDVLLHPV